MAMKIHCTVLNGRREMIERAIDGTGVRFRVFICCNNVRALERGSKGPSRGAGRGVVLAA